MTMLTAVKRITTTLTILVTFGLGVLVGIVIAEHHDAVTANSTTVSSYDDGYATSKHDDCQQGSAYACQWLRGN